MNRQKFFLMTITCAITFAVTPLIAAENSSLSAATSQKLLLAQAHDQHADTESGSKHDNKAGNKCVGHKEQEQHGNRHKKQQINYADMIASHADALELTDEQLGKIIRLRLKNAKENREIMKQAHSSMNALRKAGARIDTDDNTLRKHARDHADAINNLAEKRITQRKAIHNILTEEQLAKLKNMKMHHSGHGTDAKNQHNHH
ncbi:MAG: Spy/CpxP family protein refolding chaperone [Nitrosomonas sp.]|nr:Spy/CpxP family protein refolding chaperone [Nitrosomonas sp.]